jgi:hypothetical protein
MELTIGRLVIAEAAPYKSAPAVKPKNETGLRALRWAIIPLRQNIRWA